MEFIWILFGVAMSGSILFLYTTLKDKLTVTTWITSIVGLIAVFFGLAWMISSIIENEMRAAAMGLMIFTGFGVILLIITVRMATSNKNSEKKDPSLA